ncbi:MAG TPA: FAD-binding protein [Pseudonocardiaceae bacterium]|jgi:FAD/FMN-containing dehydrogenase|nr:FAD-binding protein [Pseudonocardiaceae bacterium]
MATGPIGRRTFLQVAGIGGAAAVLAGCTSRPGGVSAGSTTTSAGSAIAATSAGSATTASTGPPDYRALAGKLSGPLFTPGDAGYVNAALSYNPRFDGRRPAAVARCGTPADVQACVSFAARSRIPFAARSGGHSYAGYSTPDGALVADLGGMSAVSVQPDGTAMVGAGARLIDVYAGLAAAGRALPGGSCPSVGIAGLTLGGGVGVLGRKYGLTCDRLTGATVVTADGTQHAVSASDDPDVFWALRGGGGGNVGVVTSLLFDTVPAPGLTVFLLGFPAGSAGEVLGGWQHWITSAPDEVWANCNITGGNPSTCTISGCFVGSATTLNPMLDSLVRATGARPSYRTVREQSYLDAMRYFGGCASQTIAGCHLEIDGGKLGREAFAASSRILAAPLADPSAVAGVCDGHPDLHLIFDGLGGAIGRIAPEATAFPHRAAVATVQIYQKTVAANGSAATSTVNRVRDELTPMLGAGGYVNYIDAAMPNWGQAYYGANLGRLRDLARRVDPDGLFSFAQAVRDA